MRRDWLLIALLAAGGAAADTVDPAARMAGGGSASEYWDLTARFDSGHRLVERFLVTNEGPGRHTAVATGHIVLPDGTTLKIRNGRRRSDWQLDADRLGLHVGSSMLQLRGPVRRFLYNAEKRGVRLELSIQAESAGRSAGAPAPGYRVDVLDFSAPVEGTFWTRGMEAPVALRGRASLTHTRVDESEPGVALRRLDFSSLGEGPAILFYDLTTPGGERARWLAIRQAGRILYESDDLEVSLRGVAPRWSESDYPLPAEIRFGDSQVDGRIALERMLVRHDPMTDLPQPFRYLLSFKMRPRRIWADSPFEVHLKPGPDRSSLQVLGTGIAALTYLNPVVSAADQFPPEPSGA